MNYAGLRFHDTAKGPGVRVSLFVSGCEHACPGCFNPEAWPFDYGETYTAEITAQILDGLEPSYIKGFTLLGGEPLHPKNIPAVREISQAVRMTYPRKSIWCYTGYTFEELLRRIETEPDLGMLLRYIDVLVEGRFIEAQKNLALRFRGSSNQRVLDCPTSLTVGAPIELEEYTFIP
ncbi:MAG: anaerobic ribonucleoside-triphosphate reductase activating protein [Oscillospiraceae bacterium]|jgi:anaerobic ribonucleoside-triphosphate reductase activating protein|nr:anaerobic ribonucleoside-triphosphate reductase activating protein [Oscillospiraceae bacterium]